MKPGLADINEVTSTICWGQLEAVYEYEET